MEEKTEGIVLKTYEYKDKDRIAILFTPNGTLSLLVKNISNTNTHLLSLTAPLSRIECIYKPGKSDLYRFRDGTLLEPAPYVSSSMSHLTSAMTLLKALLKTQLPEKKAEPLYLLSLTYMRYIPHAVHPPSLMASFLLKLMRHEGLLHISTTCSSCSKTSIRGCFQGQFYCEDHSSITSISLTEEEWSYIQILSLSRSFKDIDTPLSKELIDKIERFFWESF